MLGITCLKRNKEQLFNLIEQIIFDPVFEEENVKNLYRAFENEAIETLTDTPIGECLDECGASLNLTSRIFNKYQKVISLITLDQNRIRNCKIWEHFRTKGDK